MSISYPDSNLEIDDENWLRSTLYDKRDDTFDIFKLFLLVILEAVVVVIACLLDLHLSV
jgi:hypothetical protein